MGSNQKLLTTAAAPTMKRIRRDRRGAPVQIRPLLEYLEAHLFDPDLDAKQLKIACGVRDNTLPLHFHHVLGLPPYAYIEDCRMQVACRLLQDTDLKVWQIAQLLGYSALPVFSRAFHRWSGLRPSIYRRKVRTDAKAESFQRSSDSARSSSDSSDTSISRTTLEKAASGSLEREEADELMRRLARLYPESFRSLASVAL